MKKMQPKTAIVYTRVSTSDQVDSGASLDNQERACYDWAFRNSVKVIKLFREEGKSAKDLNRPQMKEMLNYLEEHHTEIDYVIVYQIDRLSRSTGDFLDLVRLLAGYSISLRDSTSNLEASESDELIQSIQAALAQHENKLKSKRVSDNMRRHAANGLRMHKAPLGLKNVRDALGAGQLLSPYSQKLII